MYFTTQNYTLYLILNISYSAAIVCRTGCGDGRFSDTMNQVMKVSELKKKFRNKWVLAEVVRENELNEPVDVKPIASSSDRDEIYEKMTKVKKGKTVATFYTGKVKGAFAF